MDDLTQSFPILNNRYQIIKTLATGGMAVIYQAQDLILERKVALKVLRRDYSADQSFQNKFRKEAKASAMLNHPNIVSTYDFGIDKDHLYIVLEFIDGIDLKTLLTSEKTITLDKSLNFLIQAAEGLSYAHSMGIVHCDIKPQNLLIDKKGILKISDFGISRAIVPVIQGELVTEVWGSPYYISPEQIRGEQPTPASDLYSLGVVAYELLTGLLPFNSDNASNIFTKHLSEKPKSPISINENIYPQLNDLILQLLIKDPFKRLSNGRFFLEQIKSMYKNSISIKQSETPNKIFDHSLSNNKENHNSLDYGTIILSFIALIFTGGLIPFWIYILYSINIFGR